MGFYDFYDFWKIFLGFFLEGILGFFWEGFLGFFEDKINR